MNCLFPFYIKGIKTGAAMGKSPVSERCDADINMTWSHCHHTGVKYHPITEHPEIFNSLLNHSNFSFLFIKE